MIEQSRDELHEVYLWIVDQSAISKHLISAVEVARYIDKHPSTILSICRRLEEVGLAVGEDGVWSATEVEREDANETLAAAEEAFDKVFPPLEPKRWTPQRPSSDSARRSAYSQDQIDAGIKVKREGGSWREAAVAAGLGPASSYYFSTVLRKVDPSI